MEQVKIVFFVTRSMLGIVGIARFVEKHPNLVSGICVFPNIPVTLTRKAKKMKSFAGRLPFWVIAYKLMETYVYYFLRILTGNLTLGGLSRKAGVPLRSFSDPNSKAALQFLEQSEGNLFVNLSPALLKEEVLALPALGCVNFHGGKLPENRGVANYFWSLLLGAQEWTATLHRMTASFDEGDILVEKKIKIGLNDSVHSVNFRLIQLCPEMLETLIEGLRSGTLSERSQDTSQAAYRSFPTSKDIDKLKMMGRKIIPLRHFSQSLTGS
jgi:methionyl-tRNA formyltransferase